MTEYWVSQGNKWCEFCKIFISNNPATIRNHELGQRHKENVANRLSDMRKQKAAKQKEEQAAARALEQIEAKAKRSYQKDVASFQEARQAHASSLNDKGEGQGKWVTQEEPFSAAQKLGGPKQKETLKKPFATTGAGGQVKRTKDDDKSLGGVAPGPVISKSLNPTRSKGTTSSVAVQKRKKPDEERKPTKGISAEESAALKAREAARRRVEEREKNLLGLYGR